MLVQICRPARDDHLFEDLGEQAVNSRFAVISGAINIRDRELPLVAADHFDRQVMVGVYRALILHYGRRRGNRSPIPRLLIVSTTLTPFAGDDA